MGKLPLNDPHWLPMGAVIDQDRRQLGDLGLAIRELERDLEAGKWHSKRRNRITGESELLSASFWETYAIGYRSPLSVTICRRSDVERHKIDEYGNLIAERLDDWVFYVSVDSDSTRADRDDARDQPSPSTQKRKTTSDKKRKSYWDEPVDRVLIENFPDNDAKNFDAGDVVDKVLEVLDPEIRKSGRKPPSRGLILRKSGHWKS